jgi:hypothetical protein
MSVSVQTTKTESFVKLNKLTTCEGEAIEAILERGIGLLQGVQGKAIIEVRIRGTQEPDGTSIHSIVLSPSGAFLRKGSVESGRPTLVAIMRAEVFYGIVEGTHSPVQAYLDGKLKLLGNIELGRKLILRLPHTGTVVQVCPLLLEESWTPGALGIGSLTLQGGFFTPNGSVEIVYDWGGGFYQQILMADFQGNFTTKENLPCGDIPGKPGVGVIVTATDIATGLYTQRSYATPC